jgi:hypothetical protein
MAKLIELEKIKGSSVVLTEDEYSSCLKFLNESKNSHSSMGRSSDKKEADILNGKVGEAGFHKLAKSIFKGISSVNFRNMPYGDGNYDFVLKENLNTDVKCNYNPAYDKVFFKPVLGYDILSLVDVRGRTVTYIGSITRGESIEKMQRFSGSPEGMGYYVHRSLFENSTY